VSSVTDPLKANNTAAVKTIVEPLLLSVVSAGTDLVIKWPVEAAGYVLESTGSLEPPVAWAQVTSPAPVIVDGQKVVTMPMSGGGKFFRLRAQGP
jgi:hypothetical protein